MSTDFQSEIPLKEKDMDAELIIEELRSLDESVEISWISIGYPHRNG